MTISKMRPGKFEMHTVRSFGVGQVRHKNP